MSASYIEDTATLIVQRDASDYGIGGYVFMVTNGKVRVIRYFSKALQGAQLNWSAREKECYAIYYGVKQFEDLLDNRHFVLKTDHKNLTYINVTLTGKVLRWKLYLQDKDFHLMHVPGKEVHQFVPDALSNMRTHQSVRECIGLEWTNVIQMDHLEGVVGSARKWMCLDRDAQTVHHLTARALPNELCDHPVCDRVSFIFDTCGVHDGLPLCCGPQIFGMRILKWL